MTGMIIDDKSVVDAFLGEERLASIWLGDVKLWPLQRATPTVMNSRGASQDPTWTKENQRMTATIPRISNVNENDYVIFYGMSTSGASPLSPNLQPVISQFDNNMGSYRVYKAIDLADIGNSDWTYKLPAGIFSWNATVVRGSGIPTLAYKQSNAMSTNWSITGYTEDIGLLVAPLYQQANVYWTAHNIPNWKKESAHSANFDVLWVNRNHCGITTWSREVPPAGFGNQAYALPWSSYQAGMVVFFPSL